MVAPPKKVFFASRIARVGLSYISICFFNHPSSAGSMPPSPLYAVMAGESCRSCAASSAMGDILSCQKSSGARLVRIKNITAPLVGNL